MKAYGLIFVLFFIVLISCTSEAKYTEFSLKKTDIELKFQLDSVTKNEFYCYSTYKVYITIEKYTIFQLKSIPVLIVCEDKKSYLNAG